MSTMTVDTHCINPYLFFGGRCQEALDFYARAVGATIEVVMRFDQSPDAVPEGMLAPGFENKVMHSAFIVGSTKVLASDGCSDADGAVKQGFSLALSVPTEAEAQRTFAALAEGGEVQMPLQQTFWSPSYGMVKDRFGIAWMVMVPGPQA